MTAHVPRVSIGLPVFNGERYLAAALDSILAQTHGDFELLVSDNASTDATREIGERYALLDRRVRYLRNEINVGAAANLNQVVRLTSGEYFKWAAHDDVLAPEFLEACLEAHGRQGDLSIAMSRVTIVDESGSIVEPGTEGVLRSIDMPSPAARFRRVMSDARNYRFIWGLVPRSLLERTALFRGYPEEDFVVIAQLALLGKLVLVPRDLFLLRKHATQSVKTHPSVYARSGWFRAPESSRVRFPHWRLTAEYLRSPRSADLPAREEARCYLAVGRWLTSHWQWARLGMDLLVAVDPRFIRVYESARRRFGRWAGGAAGGPSRPAP